MLVSVFLVGVEINVRESGRFSSSQCFCTLADESWAAVDQARVKLNQAGASVELCRGIVSIEYAAHANDRNIMTELLVQCANNAVR
jgi:hypothetical protein